MLILPTMKVKNNSIAEVKTNSVQAWLLASRPKTLTGALIPVILAGALAWHDGVMRWDLLACCALFACLMQVAANLINDLYDYLKGTDREDRLGPERACSQGWITPGAMRWGIGIVVGLACIIGLVAVALSYEMLPWHGWEFVVLGASCVVFAFLYTTCLSYLGLGDVLVLVFFGLVPVCGTYFLMAQSITWPLILLGLISGVSIDALLVINNYRDRDQDRISGKRTLVVLLGEPFGRYHYLAIGIICFALSYVLGVAIGKRFIISNTALWYMILHYRTWREMCEIREGRALNKILGATSFNMLYFALFLAFAIILGLD